MTPGKKTNSSGKKPSVFERLGTKAVKASESHSQKRSECCKQWQQYGSCPQGSKCKYAHTHLSKKSSKESARDKHEHGSHSKSSRGPSSSAVVKGSGNPDSEDESALEKKRAMLQRELEKEEKQRKIKAKVQDKKAAVRKRSSSSGSSSSSSSSDSSESSDSSSSSSSSSSSAKSKRKVVRSSKHSKAKQESPSSSDEGSKNRKGAPKPKKAARAEYRDDRSRSTQSPRKKARLPSPLVQKRYSSPSPQARLVPTRRGEASPRAKKDPGMAKRAVKGRSGSPRSDRVHPDSRVGWSGEKLKRRSPERERLLVRRETSLSRERRHSPERRLERREEWEARPKLREDDRLLRDRALSRRERAISPPPAPLSRRDDVHLYREDRDRLLPRETWKDRISPLREFRYSPPPVSYSKPPRNFDLSPAPGCYLGSRSAQRYSPSPPRLDRRRDEIYEKVRPIRSPTPPPLLPRRSSRSPMRPRPRDWTPPSREREPRQREDWERERRPEEWLDDRNRERAFKSRPNPVAFDDILTSSFREVRPERGRAAGRGRERGEFRGRRGTARNRDESKARMPAPRAEKRAYGRQEATKELEEGPPSPAPSGSSAKRARKEAKPVIPEEEKEDPLDTTLRELEEGVEGMDGGDESLSDFSDDADDILNRAEDEKLEGEFEDEEAAEKVESAPEENEPSVEPTEEKEAEKVSVTQELQADVEKIVEEAPSVTETLIVAESSLQAEVKNFRSESRAEEDLLEGMDFEQISDEELEEEAKPVIVDPLEVDWPSLLKATTPTQENQTGTSSARQRWQGQNVLARLGVSSTLADENALEKLSVPSDCVQTYAALHLSHVSKEHCTKSLFVDVGPCRRALSARADLAIRRTLCQVPQKELGTDTALASGENELYKLAIQLFKRDISVG